MSHAVSKEGDVDGPQKIPGEPKKTLEEFNLEMLAQLTAAVRPARYVPNLAALQWVLDRLNSASPPTELDMEWFSIGCPQATTLATALKSNTSLRTLKLRYNEIRDEGASALAEVLECHPALETLTLGNNIIGNPGAARLATGAAASRTLRSLDLRYNAMGPGLPAPFTSLTSLTSLDLRANRLECLPAALGRLTNLQELVVERNHRLAPRSLTDATNTKDLLALLRRGDESAGTSAGT
mmetsp:Transcript_32001/g.85440  ORF Transcript_32001/g.85440 Transcript_32001/m.85440 type:complete len:239 (-) Transcript_32001:26-742(-)